MLIYSNANAGSGKTLIATATANLLVQYGLYDGIVYVVSPTQEARSGFLPGDADEKTRVYTAPLYDALETLNINPYTAVNQESIVNQKNGTGYIDCVSHLWLRGCNITKKVVIVEESQNFYIDELKKVLTRVSDTSKIIVIGHSGQCDLYHNPERIGFVPYIDGRITISVEEEGDYDLAKVLEDFNGREIKLQVTYDEDYGVEVNEDTGEIIE